MRPTRIFVPSLGPYNWRPLLREPDRPWPPGSSPRVIAHAWEAAAGLPDEVTGILSTAVGKAEALLALPHHETQIPGETPEDTSGLLVLLRHNAGLMTCAIEGKVDEPFGPTVGEKKTELALGGSALLTYLGHMLGIDCWPDDVHCRLLHRTASALIESDRYFANDAAMIVHSFSPGRRWFDAFRRFCQVLGSDPSGTDVPAVVQLPNGKRLVLGWACGDLRFLKV
jgi:hypothetical protein